MTDKTIQELALSVNRPVEKLLEQVRDAGLPQRKSDDIILLNNKMPSCTI